MGNAAAKEFAERELGQAYLDASSNKVISSDCVTNDRTQLVRKGNSWYIVSQQETAVDDLSFAMQRKSRYFEGNTQVVVNAKGQMIALLQTRKNNKAMKTLVYRREPVFDGQQADKDVYREREQKESPDEAHPLWYLHGRIQASGASKCDATYALLEVHAVYNDPDFAKFQEPPLYRAAKVKGSVMGVGFVGAVMDGSDPGGETLLGKVTPTEAELANGVDIVAVLALAATVNQTGSSARGAQKSGVV